MPAKKLSDAEISALLSKAQGWSVANGKLHKEFACKDFVTAFGNMTRVASQLGMSRNTLYRRMKRHAIPLAHGGRALSR